MLTKVWAFFVVKKYWQNVPIYKLTLSLVCVLIVHSLLELYSYIPAFRDHPNALYRGMIGYYICFVSFMTIIPFIALMITRRAVPKILGVSFIVYNIILILLLLFSDLVINGVVQLGFTYTSTKGSAYFLFLLTIFASTGYTTYILHKRNKDVSAFTYIRARNISISFFPFSLVIIGALIAIQLGVKINVLGILPITIAIFTAAIADNICNKYITDYTYWIPFSKKRRQLNRLVKPFISIQHDGLDAELKKEYNKLITQHALELFDGNQTKAAEWLKVSQSWVSRNNKNIND